MNRALKISHILRTINEPIQTENARLCALNLHHEQKALHGSDMFFRLVFMDDAALNKIATAAGY